jgi:hypothetical protein
MSLLVRVKLCIKCMIHDHAGKRRRIDIVLRYAATKNRQKNLQLIGHGTIKATADAQVHDSEDSSEEIHAALLLHMHSTDFWHRLRSLIWQI